MRVFANILARTAAAVVLAFAGGSVVHAGVSVQAAGGEGAGASRIEKLTLKGARFVDSAGRPVTLRGVNLGNWLLIETWMLGWGTVEDQYTVVKVLRERFGRERADGLMAMYRDGYVTERDFEVIKSFGFNLIRLPVGWDTLQAEEPPYGLGGVGYGYIDRAIGWAEKHGMYVVLDLHGVPGGQSQEHHTLRAKQNKLWSEPENGRRTAAIWAELARRYKDRDAVIAYDLVNEPYGDFRQDLRGHLTELTAVLYRAIREPEVMGGGGDDETLILLPAFRDNSLEFYGDPRLKGWKNVGFTDHYYAGLFGDVPAVSSHARVLHGSLPGRKRYLDGLEAAFLVGEFNVVLDEAGGTGMMRRYFDTFAENGWMATMWSYKILKAEAGVVGASNWYMVTNKAALPKLDVRTASYEEIAGFMGSLGTMELAVYEKLRKDLTSEVPPVVEFGAKGTYPMEAPHGPLPEGWSLHRIGTAGRAAALSAGVVTDAALQKVSFVAAGEDIWDRKDSFDYLARKMESELGNFEVEVTIESFADTDRWAKSGIMVRRGVSADAGHVMLNVVPMGAVSLSSRKVAGVAMEEATGEGGSFPVRLRLVRVGDEVRGSYRRMIKGGGEWGEWVEAGVVRMPGGNERSMVGLAACSHNPDLRTKVEFSDWKLK